MSMHATAAAPSIAHWPPAAAVTASHAPAAVPFGLEDGGAHMPNAGQQVHQDSDG
jgi:hypothetical protein